jgi:hypothetical protein
MLQEKEHDPIEPFRFQVWVLVYSVIHYLELSQMKTFQDPEVYYDLTLRFVRVGYP